MKSTVTSFEQANALLSSFVTNTRKEAGYTLGRMRALMEALGNPQNDLRIIHVAGTSGKTSTSYFIAALLKAAGFNTGLTVSPHVQDVNERIQINLKPLAEKQFCLHLTQLIDRVRQTSIQPSYFELLVAFAFWEFKRRAVDFAVIEVGLGGLLDATNVIERKDKICVITDIGLDHIDILGSTLPEIARQKAGIIGAGNETFCHPQAPDIMREISLQTAKQQAKLHIVPTDLDGQLNLPVFQLRNFSLALAACKTVLERQNQPPLTFKQLTWASKITIPARMEIYHTHGKTLILDGAHNEQKITALIESIRQQYPSKQIAMLVSFADGRSYRLESSLRALRQLNNELLITTYFKGQDLPHGSVPLPALSQAAYEAGFTQVEPIPDPLTALKTLLTRPEPVLLVTGSFFLMHSIRQHIHSL